MYRYIPPCLGTDVPAVAGSQSLCILAQGMRRSWSCILAQGMRLGLVGIGKAGQSARIKPKPRAHLVWSGLALKDAWAPHPIPNCKKTELRLGYRACQSIGICIVTQRYLCASLAVVKNAHGCMHQMQDKVTHRSVLRVCS